MKCHCCGDDNETVETYRQRTFYSDESANYVTLCAHCKIDNERHWDEMWADYNAGRL